MMLQTSLKQQVDMALVLVTIWSLEVEVKYFFNISQKNIVSV